MRTVLSLWKGQIKLDEIADRRSMAEICADVAARYGVTAEALRGVSRVRTLAWPRQHAYAEMYATGRFSLPQIGRFFGWRDHTTILHGVRAHKARQAAEMQEAA